jgi:hypothetical protein
MNHGKLGRTGLDVSAIGIGTEHLNGQPRETVVSTIRAAIERGVNYFDVIFAMPEYLDSMRAAFQGLRERVLLTAHLGSTERKGQYLKSRSVRRCETFFHAHLSQLNTDHVDVLFLHNFFSSKEWMQVAKSGGVLELAQRLRTEGKTRAIGISGHFPDVVIQAIDSGLVDVVMFPINLFNHALPGRRGLLDLCLQQDIGVAAMKAFGGGRLLARRGTYRVPRYQSGDEAFNVKITTEITPIKCLTYVLAQAGVSLALTGVKNDAELAAALEVLEASEAERDFSGLLTQFGRYINGECTYCNHCLPCPVVIDIGQVNRLLDLVQFGLTEDLRLAYGAQPVKASACTECGACTARCPFGVDVVPRLRQAVMVFERSEVR